MKNIPSKGISCQAGEGQYGNNFKSSLYRFHFLHLHIHFTCDTYETYPSKKPPFFVKEQMIYIMWGLTDVLPDYLLYWHWLARK
ncbi:hypothetical protein CDAR_56011 [Caerostris darwini]|uniref:Uncharacterized protein n=1 Tax=Caerostris darwini TaxID=1538125 RepID=A0AAV4RQI0_9ARAC|nr:hypothetical protein CDAR_56011 [Caerostris darwini]